MSGGQPSENTASLLTLV